MHRTGEKIKVAAVGQEGDTLEQKIERARVKTGKTNGEPIGALGESMCLQKLRTASAYALRLVGEDLLDYVHSTVAPAVGRSFGEVVKMDRAKNGGEEANAAGALVFPGFGEGTLEKETPSEEQSSPVRRRRSPMSLCLYQDRKL